MPAISIAGRIGHSIESHKLDSVSPTLTSATNSTESWLSLVYGAALSRQISRVQIPPTSPYYSP